MDSRMSSPLEEPPQGISPRIESAFLKAYSKSEICSDRVDVKCGDYMWNVHRQIITSKSTYFKEIACDKDEEEDYYKIDRTRTAEIEFDVNDDPDIITRLLTWCYGGEYHSKPGKGNAEDRSSGQKAVIDANLHNLAAKYAFKDLKTAACTRLARHLAKAVSNMPEDERVSHGKVHDIYYVIEAIELAYASGDPEPRYYVSDALRHYHSVLINFLPFQTLVKEGGDFALDILKDWVEATNSLEFICKECAYKPKYHYDESRQDMECSCCTKKMGVYLKSQPVRNYC